MNYNRQRVYNRRVKAVKKDQKELMKNDMLVGHNRAEKAEETIKYESTMADIGVSVYHVDRVIPGAIVTVGGHHVNLDDNPDTFMWSLLASMSIPSDGFPCYIKFEKLDKGRIGIDFLD